MGSIHEKNRGKKYCDTAPLKEQPVTKMFVGNADFQIQVVTVQCTR